MKYKNILLITLLLGLIYSYPLMSQGNSIGTTFLLRVESIDPENPEVSFKAAYAVYDSSALPQLIFLEGKAPFEKEMPGTHFIGLFQSAHDGPNVEVFLIMYIDGKQVASVDGAGPLSFLYADPHQIGYGLPDQSTSHLRFLDQMNR